MFGCAKLIFVVAQLQKKILKCLVVKKIIDKSDIFNV